MRILIVEDEVLIAMALETAIPALGHEVAGVAADPKGALTLAAQELPELATVNINLGHNELSGIEVARLIWTRHGVKTLFLTANCDKARREAGSLIDIAIGCVSKPFTVPILEQALIASQAIMEQRSPSAVPPQMEVFRGPRP